MTVNVTMKNGDTMKTCNPQFWNGTTASNPREVMDAVMKDQYFAYKKVETNSLVVIPYHHIAKLEFFKK